MYGDQFGEYVCGYWGLKVNQTKFSKGAFIRGESSTILTGHLLHKRSLFGSRCLLGHLQ